MVLDSFIWIVICKRCIYSLHVPCSQCEGLYICFPQYMFLLVTNSRKILSDVMLQNAPGVESQWEIRRLNVLFDMYDGYRSVVIFHLQSHCFCGRKMILLEQHCNLTWWILLTFVGFDEILSSSIFFIVLRGDKYTCVGSVRWISL